MIIFNIRIYVRNVTKNISVICTMHQKTRVLSEGIIDSLDYVHKIDAQFVYVPGPIRCRDRQKMIFRIICFNSRRNIADVSRKVPHVKA